MSSQISTSKLQCPTQDVCFSYSTVGQSMPLDLIFDEISISDRKGRNLFEPDSKFFQFDGGSFGYIKEVGEQWISNLIDMLGLSNGESIEKNEIRPKIRPKGHRRKKNRKNHQKIKENEEFIPSETSTFIQNKNLTENFPQISSQTEWSISNWHERWVNLSLYQPQTQDNGDQITAESRSNFMESDLIESNNRPVLEEEIDKVSQFNPTVTIIKYVPIIPRELLPLWQKSLQREELSPSEILSELENMEIYDNGKSKPRNKARRRFKPKRSDLIAIYTRINFGDVGK